MSYLFDKKNIFGLTTSDDGMTIKAGNTIGIDTAPQPLFRGLSASVVIHDVATDAAKLFLMDHESGKVYGQIDPSALSYHSLGNLAKTADPKWEGGTFDIGASANATNVASDTVVHAKIIATDSFCY